MPNSLWSHLFRLSAFSSWPTVSLEWLFFDSSRDLWQAASEMAPSMPASRFSHPWLSLVTRSKKRIGAR